ncbi:CBS domain-containing protein [soil metagenome]
MPGVASPPLFVSRIVKLGLLDEEGATIGKIDDLVLAPAGREPPRVLGFVAAVQRRRIFVNAARIGEVEPTGVRLRTGTIDVRPFHRRTGEVLAAGDLFDRRVEDAFITDLAIAPAPDRPSSLVLVSVALGGRGPLRRRRSPRIVGWEALTPLFDRRPMVVQVAEMRELHPTEVAARVRALPLERRRQLAELMEDERLADLLEELPEDEQVHIIESLGLERAAHVLEEMDPDDAVDLLGELPEADRMALLAAMDTEEATQARRLLDYDEATAGGLMTPEPVILPGTATVAEAMATVREQELPVALGAQVFVVDPPTSTPTGAFLGTVGVQRLLRERPGTALGDCVDDEIEAVPPEMSDADVARRLAAYDAVALAVCDSAGRLVGAVTVDDVLDHLLPEDWRVG